MIKVNASERLKATLSNQFKNEVMRALTSKSIDVERQGDSVFMAHSSLDKVRNALESAGWKENIQYKEFEKEGAEYTLAYSASGSAVRLEFTYMG